jgi:hypothetical protein
MHYPIQLCLQDTLTEPELVAHLQDMALDALRHMPFDTDMFCIATGNAAVACPEAVAHALEEIPFPVRSSPLTSLLACAARMLHKCA